MKELITMILAMTIVSYVGMGQEIDCFELNQESKVKTDEIITIGADPVVPVIGWEQLRKKLYLKNNTDEGKVRVWFVVDTTGQVQCAKVEKTDNETLNDQAIALIEETKFYPAKVSGRKVIALMILTIQFGPDPPNGRRQKNKKRKNKNSFGDVGKRPRHGLTGENHGRKHLAGICKLL